MIANAFLRSGQIEAWGCGIEKINAAYAAEIISGLTTETPLYLIIDNFQYVAQNWQPQIFAALAGRKRDGLHVVFISRDFGRMRSVCMSFPGNICRKTGAIYCSGSAYSTTGTKASRNVFCRTIFRTIRHCRIC